MHYVRGSVLALRIEAAHGLLSSPDRPIISVVTEAEIRTLSRELTWGDYKRQRMEELLARFIIIPIPFADIIDSYVTISEFCRRNGRAMGKNDLWIAATARTAGAALLTTDPRTHAQYELATTTQFEPGLYGIGIAKNDTVLRALVRAGVLVRINKVSDLIKYIDFTAENSWYYLPLENGGETHNLFLAGVSFNFSRTFSLDFKYKIGEDAPNFQRIETFEGGIGLKF